MHGLVLRTLQVFITDTYGVDTWVEVVTAADIETFDFESMLRYETDVLTRLLDGARKVLEKPVDAILEDVGTYLVSHPNSQGLRRLLRFGGEDFIDFLHSLDDLPDRARLAVADLVLPDLELLDHGNGAFELRIDGEMPAFGGVMVGVLRAMADDYGALALLDRDPPLRLQDRIQITVVESAYSEGRGFELATQVQQ